MSDLVEILDPIPGIVPLDNGTIRLRVRARGDSFVVSVRAQTFLTQAPDDPMDELGASGTPDVFEGNIAAPLGLFRIKALGEFDDGPMEPTRKAIDIGGDYTGQEP